MSVWWLSFVVGAWLMACPGLEAQEPRASMSWLSQTFTVDRKYQSMEGPQQVQPVVLMQGTPPELLWITAYRVVVVGPDGATPVSQELMCHNNLDFANLSRHQALFGWTKLVSPRLFTLSQGNVAIEFPEGFGTPVLSNEPFTLSAQVLNHNLDHPNIQVRHRVTVEYVRDRDLHRPMNPLFRVGPFVMVLLEGPNGYFGIETGQPRTHGRGCLPGRPAPHAWCNSTFRDQFGKKFSGHWTVPLGRHVYTSLVTHLMDLPFDTTLHYAAVYVHPFAESLELRDLTTHTTVFKSRITNFSDRIGIKDVELFSSEDGVPLYKDHEYEMEAVYDNSSGADQNAMASVLLYLLDTEFQKPYRLRE